MTKITFLLSVFLLSSVAKADEVDDLKNELVEARATQMELATKLLELQTRNTDTDTDSDTDSEDKRSRKEKKRECRREVRLTMLRGGVPAPMGYRGFSGVSGYGLLAPGLYCDKDGEMIPLMQVQRESLEQNAQPSTEGATTPQSVLLEYDTSELALDRFRREKRYLQNANALSRAAEVDRIETEETAEQLAKTREALNSLQSDNAELEAMIDSILGGE